jgi:hypothetical protein
MLFVSTCGHGAARQYGVATSCPAPCGDRWMMTSWLPGTGPRDTSSGGMIRRRCRLVDTFHVGPWPPCP